jgi:2-oxoacid:acceptor oxidoreductase delta subunit (pyruvate/2-ketoisovalerate family)
MPDDQKVTPPLRGIPPIAVSQTSTLVNHTGSWKYIRPQYRDRVAPCNVACPVGIDIEGYMNLLREGREEEARDLLLRENPMPAVTGRVCHHPCEDSCNRVQFDQPVAIHAVERTLGDMELDAPLPRPPGRTRQETVGIVGSGPAGLSCAYHLARLGYAVTVYEDGAEPGGMLRPGIPEYRLPRDVLDKQIARIEAQGVEIRCGMRVGDDPGWDQLGHDAVFIAAGAHRSRDAGMEGERVPGIERGLEFLKRVNAGERPDLLGKRVVVVGGGNTAMDCARTALRLGAEPLVLYRRGRAEMPAIPQEVEEADHEGVAFVYLAAPTASRSVNGRLVGLECTRMELGPPDESGRRRPMPTERGRFSVRADLVLTAIGEATDLDTLQSHVDSEAGGVRIGRLGTTSQAAVFAGGDVANEPRTVADALGSGKRAALGIDLYLRRMAGELSDESLAALRLGGGNVSMTRWRQDDPVRRATPANEVVSGEQMNLNYFEHAARHEDEHLDEVSATHAFDEANRGLSHDAALAEARRCLNCGVCNECELCLIFCPDLAISRRTDGGFEIDMNYCKGCGVCAAECPRGAITMTQEGL